MKLETTYLRPNLGTFLGVFALTIITLFALMMIIHIFRSPTPFKLEFYGWLPTLFLLASGTSIGVTFGSRRFQLIIAETADIENAKDWVMEFLSKNGRKLKEKKDSETTFESTKGFHRIFNNWFGAELISVRRVDNKIIVGGPFRLVDRLEGSVDSKLRFGKSLD